MCPTNTSDAGAVSLAEVLRAPGLEGSGPTEDPVQEILPGIDQAEQGTFLTQGENLFSCASSALVKQVRHFEALTY